MNLERLHAAEADFYLKYPQGFNSAEMAEISKKHKMGKMIEFSQQAFSEDRFTHIQTIVDDMIRVVSRASMVSVFEKPKFRDYVQGMSRDEKEALAYALKDFLHGDQKHGFNIMLDLLTPGKLAKWSLMTIIPNYYHPLDEVFVKPTTAKNVINYFQLENLEYKPRPSWEFYQEYRRQIILMRDQVNDDLKPNNAAFCGFLMMSTNSQI